MKSAASQNVRNVVIKAGSAFSRDEVTLNIECEDIEIFAYPLLEKVFYNIFAFIIFIRVQLFNYLKSHGHFGFVLIIKTFRPDSHFYFHTASAWLLS